MAQEQRLAAILFADIEGYTQKMQQDEPDGMLWLERFKESLEKEVPSHEGKIEQYYGDGCLATFQSAAAAVSCAMKLQRSFAKDPPVPVRIGLHSGDVIIQEDNVYGDSVNIASRIESMGIPFGILISKAVRDQIKNKPGFVITKLGLFDFKNVQEPMPLYAIANDGFVIPDLASMQGKGSVSQPKEKLKQRKWKYPALVLFLAMAGLGIWKMIDQFATESLPENIRQSRIAVLPFENKTNDPSLDVLGDMACDVIIQRLMNLDDVKTVSYQNVKSSLLHASFDIQSGKNLFGKLTGAEKVIQGSYYQDGQQLVFRSNILDVGTGEFDFALPEVTGFKENPSELVEKLSGKILVFFEMKNSRRSIPLDNIPTYEAYKEFRLAKEYFGVNSKKSIEHFTEAIEKDSLFFLAYSGLLVDYTNQGNYVKGDSVLSVIEKRFNKLPPQDQMMLESHKVNLSGDLRKLVTLENKMWAKDPMSGFLNFGAGLSESHINKPLKAIEVFEQLDTSILDQIITTKSATWWNEVYAHSLIRLDKFDEAQKILDLIPEELANLGKHRLQAQIDISLQRINAIDQLIIDLENQGKSPEYIAEVFTAAAITSYLHNSHDKKLFGESAVEYITVQPETIEMVDHTALAEAYYYAGHYNKAKALYTELIKDSDAGSIFYKYGDWHYLSKLGCIYARQNDEQNARRTIEELQLLDTYKPFGRYTYAQARIYAQLGEKDKAIRLMKQAMNEGFPNEYAQFRYGEDPEFIPLQGIPSFDNFVLQVD